MNVVTQWDWCRTIQLSTKGTTIVFAVAILWTTGLSEGRLFISAL